VGPIAKLLGLIMDLIYRLLYSVFGVENIGLTILVLTVLIYMFMLPLTIKQQKSSKLQQRMQPEIKAIQDKYKNKKDQQSQMAMNEEMQALYSKYGVSLTGTCLQLIIQAPVFFALYRVIYSVPAYVSGVRNAYSGLVDGIMATSGYQKIMTDFVDTMKLTSINADFTNADSGIVRNYIIDAIYKMSTSGWDTLRESFPSMTELISETEMHLSHMNNFLGLNIQDSPFAIIQSGLRTDSYLLIFLALLIPILSYASQILNVKLMPQASTDENNAMSKQMKTMNYTMPLFSLVLCFTVPVGLGIYWVFSALTRCVQQVFVNRHIANLDLDQVIAKNVEKRKKKLEKMGIDENQIRNAARMSTKSNTNLSSHIPNAEREARIERAYEARKSANPNSLAAKANLVKEFNERNNR